MNPFVGTVASTTPVVTVVTLPDPHGSQTIERVTFAASTQDLGALVAGTEYQLFQIHVPHAATRNAGACSGCCTPMWLTLDVLELSDATGTRLLPESNTVSWQGEGSPCQATRGAPTTWGSIRSLYR